MQIIKPSKLNIGDTVAIVSPSWGGPSEFPEVYELGIATLKSLGLKIKEYPSATKADNFLYDNPEFRANDINMAFADQEVKAIIASIGGEDSVRILPFLDIELIKKTPKIFMGYSDSTTINTYLNQNGLVTFNGPSIMAGFAQWNLSPAEYQEHVKTILFENPSNFEYRAFTEFTKGYLNWSDVSTPNEKFKAQTNTGWTWLQGEGQVQGRLFGGCIDVLEMMKNTNFWPTADFWQDKILFLEESEDEPSADRLRFMLRNYGMQGVFDKISALLIGRARGNNNEKNNALNEAVLSVVKVEFKNDKLPIVSNMDFGHTDPQWILPLGIEALIDCDAKRFKLTEKIYQE
jgi:muramoyltetrapeptide carboxypeptidase LdcA involved in peptidoglycan recycling